ncbi:MAG: hypothetical protein WBA28_06005 [Microbacteriaceae bacterium]
MSTFRDPVGPLPPNIYWRRRLIVGLGLLALLVIILLIIFRPGGDDKKPDPTNPTDTNQTTDPSDPATTPTTPVDAAACLPSQIELKAIADNTVYAAGVTPKLRLEITNTGAADCSLNVGTTEQQFIISSGAETIWNSKDCDAEPKDSVMVLKSRVALQTDPIEWNRTKSSASNCNAGAIAAVADATYVFKVKVGSIESDDVRLRILN